MERVLLKELNMKSRDEAISFLKALKTIHRLDEINEQMPK